MFAEDSSPPPPSSTSSVVEEPGSKPHRWARSQKKAKSDGPINAHSNPCHVEAQQSMKCLEENSYDRDKCEQYFDNYRECKKFWNGVRDSRAKRGIVPHMPAAEHRDAIKQHYRETGKIL